MAQIARGLFASGGGNGITLEVLQAVLVVLVGAVVIRLIAGLIARTLLRGLRDQSRVTIRKGIFYVGVGLLIVVALDQAGVELTALLGAAGVIGIAVGIASQASLSNVISGLFLVSEKTFEVGDVIRIGDRTGVVHSIDPLSIKLRTFDNLLVRIPNQQIIDSELVNVTRFPVRRLDLDLLVPLSLPADRALELLRESARAVSFVLDEPEPLVLIDDIVDGNMRLRLGVWFEKQNFIATKNGILIELQRRFSEAGAHFAEPVVRVVGDGTAAGGGTARFARS